MSTPLQGQCLCWKEIAFFRKFTLSSPPALLLDWAVMKQVSLLANYPVPMEEPCPNTGSLLSPGVSVVLNCCCYHMNTMFQLKYFFLNTNTKKEVSYKDAYVRIQAKP